ncbi:hypothetical protein MAMMFC1_01567 [Methylomusa anaerophila]|uniref:Uncharacterized protein n=1 Tax=Methylomusa anaerophila TaxID=1930071 RepID=A0A348AIK2_9FIRM|nr:hypothetical protein MAMMFC1_01567 [Methylomusa anaerophila]
MRLDFLDRASFRGFSNTDIVRCFGWILGVIVILLLAIEPESWYRAETKPTSTTTETTATLSASSPTAERPQRPLRHQNRSHRPLRKPDRRLSR